MCLYKKINIAIEVIKKSKLFLLLLIIAVLPLNVVAQYSEIGGGIGGFNYTGDLIVGYKPLTTRPGGSLFYRYNLSEPLSVRFGITAGNIYGSDYPPVDPFADERNYEFSIFAVEFATMFEYHFFDYKSEKSLIRWSPYLTFGAGIFTFFGHGEKNGAYSNVQPVIPVGLGFKYLINPKFILGIEYAARVTFFDYIDNISEGDLRVKNYQYGNWHTNDMYYYLGLTLNYAFYEIPCPYKY